MPRFVPLALLLLLLPLTGCLYSREMARTRHAVEQHTGADLDRQVVFTIGPLGLRTVGWMAGLSGDDEVALARTYLRDVRRVKVGVYEVEAPGLLDGTAFPPVRRLERRGWETLVRVREDDEAVWVLYRERKGRIRDLYVVALDDEELVLARVKGRLDRMVARALHERTFWDGGDTDEAEGPGVEVVAIDH